MRRVLLLMIIILLLFLPATFAGEIEFQEGLNSFFGFMPAGFDFEHARQAEGYWDRPFFELFEWGIIEPEEGFIVEDSEGPLKKGELERTVSWAKGIVKSKK